MGFTPGAISTDMNKDLLEDKQKKKEKEQSIPLKRIGQPNKTLKQPYFWLQREHATLWKQQFMLMVE